MFLLKIHKWPWTVLEHQLPLRVIHIEYTLLADIKSILVDHRGRINYDEKQQFFLLPDNTNRPIFFKLDEVDDGATSGRDHEDENKMAVWKTHSEEGLISHGKFHQ